MCSLISTLYADRGFFLTKTASPETPLEGDVVTQSIRHVAISPWTPSTSTSPEDFNWTIIPVAPPKTGQAKPLPHSTVLFPANSLGLQSFAQNLHLTGASKLSNKSKPGIEIRVLDVVPLGLHTIFVTIEDEVAKKLEETCESFVGVFGAPRING